MVTSARGEVNGDGGRGVEDESNAKDSITRVHLLLKDVVYQQCALCAETK